MIVPSVYVFFGDVFYLTFELSHRGDNWYVTPIAIPFPYYFEVAEKSVENWRIVKYGHEIWVPLMCYYVNGTVARDRPEHDALLLKHIATQSTEWVLCRSKNSICSF